MIDVFAVAAFGVPAFVLIAGATSYFFFVKWAAASSARFASAAPMGDATPPNDHAQANVEPEPIVKRTPAEPERSGEGARLAARYLTDNTRILAGQQETSPQPTYGVAVPDGIKKDWGGSGAVIQDKVVHGDTYSIIYESRDEHGATVINVRLVPSGMRYWQRRNRTSTSSNPQDVGPEHIGQ